MLRRVAKVLSPKVRVVLEPDFVICIRPPARA
jgi:hypothetical protein